MLGIKDMTGHRLIFLIAVLLGTPFVSQSGHAESPLPSVEEARDDVTDEIQNENNDADKTTNPNVLIRYVHSIDGSSTMGIRMKDEMQKATKGIEGDSHDRLNLSSGCHMAATEDYGSSEFGNWKVDPSEFDFVVTNTMEGYTKESEFFDFNRRIQLTEIWEVKKGLDATISKKWKTSFELLVDAGLVFEQEDFEESLPMLLTTVVAPRRGPILKEICGFIQEHVTHTPS